jgi:hypothetical protein
VPLSVTAALAATLGVLWGKYFAFVRIGQAFVEERFPGSDIQVPVFSGRTFELFTEGFSELFSGWDVAWIALAIFTAWRIPQGKGFGRWAAGRTPASGR